MSDRCVSPEPDLSLLLDRYQFTTKELINIIDTITCSNSLDNLKILLEYISRSGIYKVLSRALMWHTIIHNRCDDSIVEYVARYYDKYNLNLNLRDTAGYTALHMAVICNNYTAFRYLLQLGADISILSPSGLPLLHYTVKYGRFRMMHYIIDKYFTIDELDSDKRNIMHHIALRHNKPTSFEKNNSMLQVRDKYGKLPIEYAIESKNTNFIKAYAKTECDLPVLTDEAL